MNSPFENLSGMEYPGRILGVGRDASGLFDILIYAITGRSPSSQARRLELESDAIWTKPTDPQALRKGKVDLLIYPAVIFKNGLAASNGKQTTDIAEASGLSPIQVLDQGMKKWDYEPDAPTFTPRIGGCILPAGRAGLSLLKRAENGACLRYFYEVPLIPGKGSFVATYAGDNKDPLPPFTGEPKDLGLGEPTARAMAEGIYDSLRPPGRALDFRVAVACIFADPSDINNRQVFIINRQERK